MTDNAKGEQIFEGIAASPGIAYGQAFVVEQKELEIPIYRIDIANRGHEIARFEQALLATRQQITNIQQEIARNLGDDEARIFDAHLLVLEDQLYVLAEPDLASISSEDRYFIVGVRCPADELLLIDPFGSVPCTGSGQV